ncbi:hypothetical protein HD806DRAFT_516691 [Xylariaceae sp. AK1471]|nr:hypothetical protein HD806DRAFT_516691 [Xylariaceae sp. AK1471]
MLQTWRLNSKDQNETYQRQAFDPETARPIVQQACNSCRIKKLRCSGEKTGCARCQTLSQNCVYAQNSARGSGRARKNKESTSKINDDAQSLSLSATAEARPASPRPDPSTPVSNAPNAEPHIASVRPRSNATNTVMFELDKIPFESHDYLSIQEISAMQMTCQGADAWPWEGDTMGPSAMPLSLPSLERRDSVIQGYNETPLTPTSKHSAFFSDIQMSPLHPAAQMVAGQRAPEDRDWLDSQTRNPCQCLPRVVFILEELDCGGVDTNGTELGPWLSRHKEALRCSEALLLCPFCQAKLEHMTILAFLTNRLIAMSDDVVSAYLEVLQGGTNHSSLGPKDGAWLVCVGNFEIDSPHEWSALVCTMLILQLRELDALMIKFKGLLPSIGSEGVRRRADATQRRIVALLQKLNTLQGHS